MDWKTFWKSLEVYIWHLSLNSDARQKQYCWAWETDSEIKLKIKKIPSDLIWTFIPLNFHELTDSKVQPFLIMFEMLVYTYWNQKLSLRYLQIKQLSGKIYQKKKSTNSVILEFIDELLCPVKYLTFSQFSWDKCSCSSVFVEYSSIAICNRNLL